MEEILNKIELKQKGRCKTLLKTHPYYEGVELRELEKIITYKWYQ